MGRMLKILVAGLCAAILVTQTAGLASARVGGSRGGRSAISAQWLGLSGDLIGTGNTPGSWNHPDGYDDAAVALTFNRVRGHLDSIAIFADTGCYWKTYLDPGFVWGLGVTGPRGSSLLNVDGTINISLNVRAGSMLTLRMQEPWGTTCAHDTRLEIHVAVDGVDHVVEIETT